MMHAISHGHMTRRMWTINQTVHTWTANNIGQLLQLIALHRRLLGALCSVDTGVAWTRRSLKFLGRHKATNGGSRNAFLSHSEAWRIVRWHLVVEWKVGKIGWHLTIKGMRADLSWFCISSYQASLDVFSARWISKYRCCSSKPHFLPCLVARQPRVLSSLPCFHNFYKPFPTWLEFLQKNFYT